ncbi:dnaJ domain-containing protein [Artemisia annua]|uniref:DnaJ domain-containing protein n=1 Tax=Artemisia annua TaxID=35608 RepID=A0A2U1L708_ARTAN|nr:dnaJ domain-containing protein [Artemisia annua]
MFIDSLKKYGKVGTAPGRVFVWASTLKERVLKVLSFLLGDSEHRWLFYTGRFKLILKGLDVNQTDYSVRRKPFYGDEGNEFYHVLGLKKRCIVAVKNSYKRLPMRWHPDRWSTIGGSRHVEETGKKLSATTNFIPLARVLKSHKQALRVDKIARAPTDLPITLRRHLFCKPATAKKGSFSARFTHNSLSPTLSSTPPTLICTKPIFDAPAIGITLCILAPMVQTGPGDVIHSRSEERSTIKGEDLFSQLQVISLLGISNRCSLIGFNWSNWVVSPGAYFSPEEV